MTLSDKQARFADMLVDLLAWTRAQRTPEGDRRFRVRFADAYRDPRCGYGHPRSLHRQRLAVDLVLDEWNGSSWVYRSDTESHRPLGEEWERMGGSWGGRFNDGNHFSLAHGDMR